MSRRKKTDGVQDALIPDEMSPLKLLDFNAGNAKIKQAAVDLRRSVNTAKPMSSKTEYLAKFQHIDAVTEAIFDVDVLAQHIVDCAEAINRLLTYPREARRTIMLDDLHRSLKPFEESAETVPEYPFDGDGENAESNKNKSSDAEPGDDPDQLSVDPDTGEIKED